MQPGKWSNEVEKQTKIFREVAVVARLDVFDKARKNVEEQLMHLGVCYQRHHFSMASSH